MNLQALVRERLVPLAGVVALYGIYFPMAPRVRQLPAHDLTLAIDRACPLIPQWIYIYALVYLIGFIPIAVVRTGPLFDQTVKAYVAVELAAFSLFVFFPVHMLSRPESVIVDSFATWGLMICYTFDPPTNCFPSLHVAMSTLSALICLKADRIVGILTAVAAGLIAVSTLLVKQHFFLDVIAGFALAQGAYLVFVARLRIPASSTDQIRYPRRYPLMLTALYFAALAAMGVLYLRDYQPWVTSQ
jgi:membrane-associated phospholipid phosphatase